MENYIQRHRHVSEIIKVVVLFLMLNIEQSTKYNHMYIKCLLVIWKRPIEEQSKDFNIRPTYWNFIQMYVYLSVSGSLTGVIKFKFLCWPLGSLKCFCFLVNSCPKALIIGDETRSISIKVMNYKCWTNCTLNSSNGKWKVWIKFCDMFSNNDELMLMPTISIIHIMQTSNIT